MRNSDMPAMPIWNPDMSLGADAGGGLTKREQFCLTMGVAETGDTELDAIITKGNKQKIAALAMQGLLAKGGWEKYENCAISSDNFSHALLKVLED